MGLHRAGRGRLRRLQRLRDHLPTEHPALAARLRATLERHLATRLHGQ